MSSPRQNVNEFDEWVKVRSLWTSANDSEFYRGIVNEHGRPAVDLGIGDGRVAAVSRPDVGIDISPESLRRCAEALGEGVCLVQADLADYSIKEPARISYASLNTFNHILDSEHRIRVFGNVLRNTLPGGAIVFDASNASRESLLKYDRIPVEQARDNDMVFYLNETVLDSDLLLTAYHGVLEYLDNGRAVDRVHLPPLHRVYVPPHQFAIELSKSGWKIQNLYGGFDMSPYRSTSRKQVWVAVKAD